MKLIAFLVLFCAQTVLATYDGNPRPPRDPFDHQMISYTRKFFLDVHTFDRRQINRLDLDTWEKNERNNWDTEYKLTQTQMREGVLVTLTSKGEAEDVARVFENFLTSLLSVIATKGGWTWNLPTSTYTDYWESISKDTRKEIRHMAVKKWLQGSQISGADYKKGCELLLKESF